MAMFKKPSMFQKELIGARDEGESWSPDDPVPPNRTVPVRPKGEIKGTEDTLRDRLVGLIATGLDPFAPDGRSGYQMAGKLTDLAEINPAVGLATSGDDFYRAAKVGDKSDMASAALFAGLNAAGMKPLGAALKGGMRGKTYPWGELDPFRPKVR